MRLRVDALSQDEITLTQWRSFTPLRAKAGEMVVEKTEKKSGLRGWWVDGSNGDTWN